MTNILAMTGPEYENCARTSITELTSNPLSILCCEIVSKTSVSFCKTEAVGICFDDSTTPETNYCDGCS